MSRRIEGQCLCGAVRLRAVPAPDAVLRACHCEMCRRLTSGAFVSLAVDQDGLEVTGPVRTYVSSDWAERASCEVCGSVLWYATRADGVRNLSAGLFENAGGAKLAVEYFTDSCPAGYGFAGDHARLDRAKTIALFAGGDA